MNIKERRSEPRIEASTSVVVTPLAAVATHLNGAVVNLSTRGVRVHFAKRWTEPPRVGEIFRVQSRDDLLLCEVRHTAVAGEGADLGLQIVHWGGVGELQRLVQNHQRNTGSAAGRYADPGALGQTDPS